MRHEVATRSEQDLLPGYAEWLERLSATYNSVAYCCFHRLRDREAAKRVSVEVVAEMLARPRVFRYFGLPFSGQVGRLAEPRIAEARQGTTVGDSEQGWEELLVRLRSVSKEHQEVFVLTCTEDHTDPDVAVALGCDEDTARVRRENTINLLQELSESVLAPTRRGEYTDDGEH
jgi:DNA-directed RNA polymerase specialized sigma24 family protein